MKVCKIWESLTQIINEKRIGFILFPYRITFSHLNHFFFPPHRIIFHLTESLFTLLNPLFSLLNNIFSFLKSLFVLTESLLPLLNHSPYWITSPLTEFLCFLGWGELWVGAVSSPLQQMAAESPAFSLSSVQRNSCLCRRVNVILNS